MVGWLVSMMGWIHLHSWICLLDSFYAIFVISAQRAMNSTHGTLDLIFVCLHIKQRLDRSCFNCHRHLINVYFIICSRAKQKIPKHLLTNSDFDRSPFVSCKSHVNKRIDFFYFTYHCLPINAHSIIES